MSAAPKAPDSLFASLMAERGLDVADVALECGVTWQAANDWRRGVSYPSVRYAADVEALFGKADARRVYQEREAHKTAARKGRYEGRTLRAAANALEARGLGDLAERVRREADRATAAASEERAA